MVTSARKEQIVHANSFTALRTINVYIMGSSVTEWKTVTLGRTKEAVLTTAAEGVVAGEERRVVVAAEEDQEENKCQ